MLDHEPAEDGRGVALNAHIDTVAPYFAPVLKEQYLTGRGSADDKGNVAVVVGTLIALDELARRRLVVLKNRLTAMFVIDEETGGNGSLALAMDRSLRERYGSIVVMECTDKVIHPANRGAVFLRCECSRGAGQGSGASLAEACAFGILELLEEGERIKLESDHPLFPHRPVQTCTGILGPFGVHPSAICGEVAFLLESAGTRLDENQLTGIIQKGVAEYVVRFGDKTKQVDPVTKKKKVEKHFDLTREGSCFRITVHGSSGHMGSLPQNDAAIAKWAYIVCELVLARKSAGLSFDLTLPPGGEARLVFEGAQGFLPTHSIERIVARMRRAFLKGVDRYLEGLPRRHPDPCSARSVSTSSDRRRVRRRPKCSQLEDRGEGSRGLGLMAPGAALRGWGGFLRRSTFCQGIPGAARSSPSGRGGWKMRTRSGSAFTCATCFRASASPLCSVFMSCGSRINEGQVD